MALEDLNLAAAREKAGPSTKLFADSDLSSLSQADLITLRERIDASLTGVRLSEVNIARELLIQMQKAKQLQEDSDSQSTPANQRAQVQNSLSKILTDLAKLQNATYTAERFKQLEGAIIRVLRDLPKEAQEAFFTAYISEADLELL